MRLYSLCCGYRFEDLSVTKQFHRRGCDFWSPWSCPRRHPFPLPCFHPALFMLATALISLQWGWRLISADFRSLTMLKTIHYFFVTGFIVLKKNVKEFQSFKHNTHSFVSTIPEIWFQTILYRCAESNPLPYLILAVDGLRSTAHAETESLWINIPIVIKHPVIQHLICHLNWEFHH